jgi:cytochrome P450
VVDLLSPGGTELHEQLHLAAARGPFVTDEMSGATVFLRHADVSALARDERVAGVGLTFFDLMGISDGPLRDWYSGLMFTNEGPTHDRLRKLVSRAFSPRSVEGLRDVASTLANQRLAEIADAGGGDITEAFSLVAMHVMCALLGVPSEDVKIFGAWADALSPTFGWMDPDQIDAATSAITELLAYVEELAERRRTDPANDLITALHNAEDEGDRLTHDELVAMVANLLVGGHDTTTSQIGCSILTLLSHPDEAARLRKDPALLVSAVEETIRFEPSIPAVPRTAVAPIDIAGTRLETGAMIMLCTAAANREPGVWDEPDRFDVARFTVKGLPALLTFGAGQHFCLGAALARMTLQECVRAVVQRDCITLADDPATLPWRVVLGRSPARLPVHA